RFIQKITGRAPAVKPMEINASEFYQFDQTSKPKMSQFARATYDFAAESPMELSLKKGDIVAIITKLDPVTNAASQWWKGRLRDGTMGMFPANYVEIIQKAPKDSNEVKAIKEADDAMKVIEETKN
ncbi:Peroxisomal membrane protein PAS20, partial [Rhizopus azygosporus]